MLTPVMSPKPAWSKNWQKSALTVITKIKALGMLAKQLEDDPADTENSFDIVHVSKFRTTVAMNQCKN